jgi:hypothetical protein
MGAAVITTLLGSTSVRRLPGGDTTQHHGDETPAHRLVPTTVRLRGGVAARGGARYQRYGVRTNLRRDAVNPAGRPLSTAWVTRTDP